jgi:hypothetical protein
LRIEVAKSYKIESLLQIINQTQCLEFQAFIKKELFFVEKENQ